MRDLLGKAIENASEHHSVINARVGISEDLDSILPKFEYHGPLQKIGREKQEILDGLQQFVHGQSKVPEEIESKYREIGDIVDDAHRHSRRLTYV